MTTFWTCKTPTWSRYYANIEYLSDPSLDLLNRFKKDIIDFENPMTHPAYVECTHIEESKDHMLFILDSRVEIIIYPVKERKILYFVSCEDNQ